MAQTAASLEIRPDFLNRCRKEHSASKAAPFPANGHLKDPEEEWFTQHPFHIKLYRKIAEAPVQFQPPSDSGSEGAVIPAER